MKYTVPSKGEGGGSDSRFWSDRGLADDPALFPIDRKGKRKEKVTVTATLVDRAYLGLKDKSYQGTITKDVPTDGWAFALEARNPETGQPWRVASDKLTRSLHERASMRQWYEALTGVTLEEGQVIEDLDEFLDQAKGCSCLMELTRVVSAKGTPYVKIGGVMPLPAGMPRPAVPTDPTLVEVDESIPF